MIETLTVANLSSSFTRHVTSSLNWISIGYNQAPVLTECQTESTYASLLDYVPLKSPDLWLIDVPTVNASFNRTRDHCHLLPQTLRWLVRLSSPSSDLVTVGCATFIKLFVNHIKHRHGIGWQAGVTDLA